MVKIEGERERKSGQRFSKLSRGFDKSWELKES